MGFQTEKIIYYIHDFMYNYIQVVLDVYSQTIQRLHSIKLKALNIGQTMSNLNYVAQSLINIYNVIKIKY